MNLKQAHLCFVGNMLGKNPDYVLSQGEITAELFSKEGYKVSCVSSKINRIARLWEIVWTLVKGCRTFDVVLVDTYSGASFVIADVTVLLCKILKIPSILKLCGGNLPNFSRKHPRWTKRVLNHSSGLVAPSSYLAEKIGARGYEIQVIPNVIALNLYQFRERSKILPRLIWMRSFHSVYNPEMAIKVLAELRKSVPSATLVMAGSDNGLECKIKKMTEDLGLSDAVRFVGFLNLEQKLKEFSDADIYINTNRIDNMPVSVVEARALGLAVVATSVGGLPYLIEHLENGLLSPSEDVDSMVKNIKLLLDTPELTRKISQKGRAIAEASAWATVRQELEAMIKKVLGKKLLKNKTYFCEDKSF